MDMAATPVIAPPKPSMVQNIYYVVERTDSKSLSINIRRYEFAVQSNAKHISRREADRVTHFQLYPPYCRSQVGTFLSSPDVVLSLCGYAQVIKLLGKRHLCLCDVRTN